MLWFLAAASVSAQVKDRDFTQQNEAWGQRVYGSQQLDMRRYMDERMSTPNVMNLWTPKFSAVGEKMAPFGSDHLITPGRVEYGRLNYSVREMVMAQQHARMSSMPGLDGLREIVIASRFENPNVWAFPDDVRRLQDMVDQLSMQDINRFQFRRNHSDAPGLIVQTVARNMENEAREKSPHSAAPGPAPAQAQLSGERTVTTRIKE